MCWYELRNLSADRAKLHRMECRIDISPLRARDIFNVRTWFLALSGDRIGPRGMNFRGLSNSAGRADSLWGALRDQSQYRPLDERRHCFNIAALWGALSDILTSPLLQLAVIAGAVVEISLAGRYHLHQAPRGLFPSEDSCSSSWESLPFYWCPVGNRAKAPYCSPSMMGSHLSIREHGRMRDFQRHDRYLG